MLIIIRIRYIFKKNICICRALNVCLHSRLDDEFLIRFLRAKKFDGERAFQCLLNHYQTRQDDPEIFENYLPSRVKPVLEQGIHAPQKLHDDQGRQIFIFRPGV